MEVYDGKLYAIEASTGKIFVSSSPVAAASWSLSCDTTATDMERLRVYNGNLYVVGSDGSTFTRVYAFDGTDWTTSTDISSGASEMAMAIHRNKLYVTADGVLHSYNGTKWVIEDATLGINVEDMVSWKGNLLLLEASGGEDLYYFDPGSGAAVNIYSSLDLSIPTKMNVYQGNLFMAHQATSAKMFIPLKEMLITIQNQNGTNYL